MSDQEKLDNMPEIELFNIGPQEALHTAPLLTDEATGLIRQGQAFGLCAVEEGEARGAICARMGEEGRMLDIISLYVSPNFRGRGLGSTLLYYLLEDSMAAVDGSIGYANAFFSERQTGLETFFTQAGFFIEPVEDAQSWNIRTGALEGMPLMRKRVPCPKGGLMLALKDTSEHERKSLMLVLRKHGIDYISDLQRAEAMASHILFYPKGTPAACCIFTEQEEGRLALSQFFTNSASSQPAMSVLQACARELLSAYPPDTILEIPAVNNSSMQLIRRLLEIEDASETMLRATLALDA